MGVKTGLWRITCFLVCVVVGAIAIWANCLPLNSSFSSGMAQDDFILLGVVNIGTIAVLMINALIPNIMAVQGLADLGNFTILLSFCIMLAELAAPTVLLSFYRTQGRDLRDMGSPLFAPMVAWVFLVYTMAVFEILVFMITLVYQSREPERLEHKRTRDTRKAA
jgi:hypothetical protein